MARNNNQQPGAGGYDPYLSDDFFMGSQPAPQSQPPVQQGGKKGKRGKKPKKVQSVTERVKSLSRLAAICVGIAVVAVIIGIWGTLNGQRIAADAKADAESIVVTTTDIARGDEITESNIQAVDVPKAYRTSGAINWGDREVLLGKRAATGIASGTQVSLNEIQGIGSKSSLSQTLPEGREAVTIEADSLVSMSNLIKIGDRVRIIEIPNDEAIARDITTATVLALGNSLYDVPAGTEYGTITVDVSPADASRIRLAQNVSHVTVALEPYTANALGGMESTQGDPNAGSNPAEDQLRGYGSTLNSVMG